VDSVSPYPTKLKKVGASQEVAVTNCKRLLLGYSEEIQQNKVRVPATPVTIQIGRRHIPHTGNSGFSDIVLTSAAQLSFMNEA
jgi:hypothetical protein